MGSTSKRIDRGQLRTVAANCGPLARGFAALATTAEHRRGLLTNLVIDRAAACGCETVDMAARTATVQFMRTGDDPGLRWLELRFDGKSATASARRNDGR